MVWQHNTKLKNRAYKDQAERGAWSAGYSDGYHGYPKQSSCEPHYYPNAYSNGYWEGVADGGKSPVPEKDPR